MSTSLMQIEWIKADERKPKDGIPVLVAFVVGDRAKVLKWARAMWVGAKSLSTEDAPFDEGAEYDEETDTYYWPEGWYEWNQYEETHWRLDNGGKRVTHWAYVPAPADRCAA